MITDIRPIKDADAIECARVLGWDVVIKKGEFAPGDLAIYIETDVVPPAEGTFFHDAFKHLWAKYETMPRKYRIKTIKLRGQLSQGLLLPLTIMDEWVDGVEEMLGGGMIFMPHVGMDVSDILGVTKYEPKLPASDEIIGEFMPGVSKTDETRVQSNPNIMLALSDRPYIITEKADGASMTMGIVDDEFAVYGRKYRLRDDGGSHWRAARSYPFEEWCRAHPQYALQGELVGPGVQKNLLGFIENTCLIFNVYDRNVGRRLHHSEFKHLIGDMPTVKIIEEGPHLRCSMETLLSIADGYYEGTDNLREGIVIRANDGFDPYVSFKAISNKYLLKGGE